MRRRRFLFAAALLCIPLLWALYLATAQGIVLHSPKADPSAESYAEQFPKLDGRESQGFAVSYDRRFVAFDVSAARSFHTVTVWDRWSETVTPIVSIQEMDPGSGVSHFFAWSADQALLIGGVGRLPFGSVHELCLVYIPTRGSLLEAPSCS